MPHTVLYPLPNADSGTFLRRRSEEKKTKGKKKGEVGREEEENRKPRYREVN